MIKLIYIPLILSPYLVFSQQENKKYSVKKSTITLVGSSNAVIKNKNLSVLQSIGQSSIVGLKKLNSITVQQGFINNSLIFNINNNQNNFIREELDFVISPNPFIDHVNINFSKKTKYDINVRVYDVNGKSIINKKYKATDKITVQLNGISIGTYLIKIDSGINSSTKKILKKD